MSPTLVQWRHGVEFHDLAIHTYSHEALRAHYAGSQWVTVEEAPASGKLDALALKDTNKMELRVFGNDHYHHAVLVARLDNLGKGASGAAVQNLQLMLGL